MNVNLELTGGLLHDQGQRSGFVVLAAFLIAFLVIRTSARMTRSTRFTWWPGAVKTPGGLHIHHLVWGITLLLVTGFLSMSFDAISPWREVLAIGFGIGAGLTLDEFALLVHLDDVYWAEEGRKSLDAVVVAALVAGIVVVGIAPFDLKNGGDSVLAISVTALIVFGLSAVAIGKGKLVTGLAGMCVPVFGLIGAMRLARPASPWASRWYGAGSAKRARSEAREQRREELKRTWADRVGGAPSDVASGSLEDRVLAGHRREP